MAESRAVWGIDIGQAGLKAIKLRYSEATEQAVAVAFDYVAHPKILSQPDAIPEELIPQALETFLSRNDVEGDLISIAVPGQSALVRFIQLPPVEASKVPEIVKYEARQQIPFPLDEVIWDYQPLGGGQEESGFMLDAEVGLFAMKREQVMNSLRPFTDAKLEVEEIQIAPLALYNMLCYDELGIRPGHDFTGGEDYYIVLDMGCDNTTLMISNGDKVWIRNVPIGGNHFTRALTKEMKLSFAKAEHLKCNATKSPDPRAVFQALRPVFNDYVSEIQRSIGYFSSVNRQAKITKVLGMGNAFRMAGLQKFLQQNLQYDVIRPDSYQGLAGDAVVNAPLFQENLLSFAVPYGLALQTLGLGRINTTLLPPEIAKARLIRRKKPWAVATAATLLFFLSIAMVGNGMSYQTVHTEEFAAAESQADQLTQQVNGLQSAYQSEVSRFETAKGMASTLVEGRRSLLWLELYNSINACLPRDPAGQPLPKDITKRHRIDVQAIASEHVGDVSEWFNELDDQKKQWMAPEDRATAPSGEGYIFTLQGRHWHHEQDPEMQRQRYVFNTLLKNLKQWRVRVDGVPHDVRRMGITHPTIVIANSKQIPYYPNGRPEQATRQKQAPSRFGGSLRQPTRQPIQRDPTRPNQFKVDDPNVQIINQTDFAVQFVWQKIPESERVDVDPRTTGGDAAVPAETPADDEAY